MPKITINHITKYYVDSKKRSAIAGIFQVSAEIPDASFVVLVGPSGCGKTTLLKVLAGLNAPDEGSIQYNGQDIFSIAPHERNIAFVTQEYALYPNRTIFDNIAYPLIVAKVPVEEIRHRVHEIAQLLDIEILLSRKPKVLSGGQRQRAALARALVKRPDILLMDEPLSSIDDPTRFALRQLLKSLQQRFQMTVILSTHRQEDAYFWADWLIEMENGSITKTTQFKNGVPV